MTTQRMSKLHSKPIHPATANNSSRNTRQICCSIKRRDDEEQVNYYGVMKVHIFPVLECAAEQPGFNIRGAQKSRGTESRIQAGALRVHAVPVSVSILLGSQ